MGPHRLLHIPPPAAPRLRPKRSPFPRQSCQSLSCPHRTPLSLPGHTPACPSSHLPENPAAKSQLRPTMLLASSASHRHLSTFTFSLWSIKPLLSPCQPTSEPGYPACWHCLPPPAQLHQPSLSPFPSLPSPFPCRGAAPPRTPHPLPAGLASPESPPGREASSAAALPV